MFLNYLALVLILIVLVMLFYTFIYIHELPYEAAKHRNHPHAEAIYVACWISLFTLHAIWPIVFIWAMMHRGAHDNVAAADGAPHAPNDDLVARLIRLENRLASIEQQRGPSGNAQPAGAPPAGAPAAGASAASASAAKGKGKR
jgi:hypothetical protein